MSTVQRSDATRSRARILDAARGCDPAGLRLNDIARRAGVGVGTVYRHFPSVHALAEALVSGDLERYRELARRAVAESDPARALELLVREGLALQLEDGGLQAVLLAPEDTSPAVAGLKRELLQAAETVLARGRAAGVVRGDLTAARLQHLVCGAEHAARLGAPADREFFVSTVLAGLRPVASAG